MDVNKTNFEVWCCHGLGVLLDSGCWFLVMRNVLSFAVRMNRLYHPAAGRMNTEEAHQASKTTEVAIKRPCLGSHLQLVI